MIASQNANQPAAADIGDNIDIQEQQSLTTPIAVASMISSQNANQPSVADDNTNIQQQQSLTTPIAVASMIASQNSNQPPAGDNTNIQQQQSLTTPIAIATAITSQNESLYDIIFKNILGKDARNVKNLNYNEINSINNEKLNENKILSEYDVNKFENLKLKLYQKGLFKKDDILNDMKFVTNEYDNDNNNTTLLIIIEIWNKCTRFLLNSNSNKDSEVFSRFIDIIKDRIYVGFSNIQTTDEDENNGDDDIFDI